MIDKNIGGIKMTVNQMGHQLSNAYVSLIKTNTELKKFPSVIIVCYTVFVNRI